MTGIDETGFSIYFDKCASPHFPECNCSLAGALAFPWLGFKNYSCSKTLTSCFWPEPERQTHPSVSPFSPLLCSTTYKHPSTNTQSSYTFRHNLFLKVRLSSWSLLILTYICLQQGLMHFSVKDQRVDVLALGTICSLSEWLNSYNVARKQP